MQNLQISLAQRFLVIVGILAAIALAANIPHLHTGKGHRELGRIELSAGSSRVPRDCIWSSHTAGTKRVQRSMQACKRYSAAYSTFDVICPSLYFAVSEIVRAYFLPHGLPLFPPEQQSFLYPS
jgi:hypothetical protein